MSTLICCFNNKNYWSPYVMLKYYNFNHASTFAVSFRSQIFKQHHNAVLALQTSCHSNPASITYGECADSLSRAVYFRTVMEI